MRRAELKRHTAAFSDGGGELSVSSPAATEWHLFFFGKGLPQEGAADAGSAVSRAVSGPLQVG